MAQGALAEALCGNMSTHVVYAVRATDPVDDADPLAPGAIAVGREMPAEELARQIRPDGMLGLVFDGLHAPVPLPPLAGAILRRVDGVRPVGAIADDMAATGIDRSSFERAWGATFAALSRVNRVLLAAPP